jgi:hypothetical protein
VRRAAPSRAAAQGELRRVAGLVELQRVAGQVAAVVPQVGPLAQTARPFSGPGQTNRRLPQSRRR